MGSTSANQQEALQMYSITDGIDILPALKDGDSNSENHAKHN